METRSLEPLDRGLEVCEAMAAAVRGGKGAGVRCYRSSLALVSCMAHIYNIAYKVSDSQGRLTNIPI